MSPNEPTPLSWDELPALFPEFPAPARWLALLQRHLSLVERASSHTRVTSVPAPVAVRRHYAESLEMLRLTLIHAPAPRRITDVGSGGGYPGLVIATILPDVLVELVEPHRRRAHLLESMGAELGLGNVTVHALRAEEAGRSSLRDSARIVTARAVAPLAELIEYTAPLAAAGGLVALAKGSALEGELAEAGPAISALSCELVDASRMRPEISSTVSVLCLRKTGPTSEKFPRRAGMAGKRPFGKH